MWTVTITLSDSVPADIGYGTLTAVWDDPEFTYSEQGTADDKDNFLDRAEICLKSYIDRLNAQDDFNTTIQTAADARPVKTFPVLKNPVVKTPVEKVTP